MQNLIELAFNNQNEIFQLREALIRCRDESLLELTDAVVATRDESGGVKLHQFEGAAAGMASAGSVVGLIVGMIFMQPWAGSLVGAGAGAVVGALVDLGINDKFMKDVGATITPGTSALFLLARNAQLDKLQARLGPLLKGGTVLQTTVTKDRENEIRKMLEGA